MDIFFTSDVEFFTLQELIFIFLIFYWFILLYLLLSVL